MTEDLKKKVEFGIKLIQAGAQKAAESGQPIEIAYSGGKDSDCILELARMAGVNYRAIYKNTTIDPPGTIKHAKENGVEIIHPKKTFRELIRDHGGMPSRFRRFCCDWLKEYKILDYAVVGIRRCESAKRSARYKEPELCRVYRKDEKTRQYLPILEWSDKDVSDFITERGIKCHPLYYDEHGNFHVERRLGCMCCPLMSHNKRIEEFKKRPKMVRFYVENAQYYLDTHPQLKINKLFKNAYEWFVMALFTDSMREFRERFGANLFSNGTDCKKLLEQYFGIEL